MCTAIADALNERGMVLKFASGRTIPQAGRDATPEEVFNYSRTGELFMVPLWYWMLYPERLPAHVEHPEVGQLRYNREQNAIESFDGREWR